MVKKLCRLLVGLILFASFAPAIAGGVEYPSAAGFYLEANGGYSYRNWRDDGNFQNYLIIVQAGTVLGTLSNGQNGLTVGADLGYQVNEYIALETGWYYLPQVRYTVPSGVGILLGSPALGGNNLVINSWLYYFGGKLMVPIYHRLYLFGKLAAAYINVRGSLTAGLSSIASAMNLPTSGNFWAPLFATGVQYDITWNWSVNLQYLFVEGNSHTPFGSTPTTLPSPDTNLFTVGVAYKFAI
jgi:opacity protein-like surface antigen